MTAMPVREESLKALFAAIDSMDSDAFVAFLTADAEFRFGSAPAVAGREAIRAAVDGFFSTIAALSHRVTATFPGGGSLACEGEVTYTRHDGRKVVLPFADVFEFDGELITNYKIYMDISPLYAD